MKQEREKIKNIMLNTSSRILENVNIKQFPGYVITGSFKAGKAHFFANTSYFICAAFAWRIVWFSRGAQQTAFKGIINQSLWLITQWSQEIYRGITWKRKLKYKSQCCTPPACSSFLPKKLKDDAPTHTLGWEVTGGAFLWYILPSQLYEIRIGNDIRRKYVCSYSVASGTREGASRAVLGGWGNSTSCEQMSPTGSHPITAAVPSPGNCTGLLKTSPLATALHQIPNQISPIWRDAHGLPEAPCLPPHIWNVLPKESVVLPARVFSECPLLPPSPGALWSGFSPGKLQSASRKFSFKPPPLPPANGFSPLPREGRGSVCGGAVAYTSVCQIFITSLQAEPAWLPELWGRNSRDTALVLSQFAALGNRWLRLFHGRTT